MSETCIGELGKALAEYEARPTQVSPQTTEAVVRVVPKHPVVTQPKMCEPRGSRAPMAS